MLEAMPLIQNRGLWVQHVQTKPYGHQLPYAVPVITWELYEPLPEAIHIGDGNLLVVRGMAESTGPLDKIWVEINGRRIKSSPVAPFSSRHENGKEIRRYRIVVIEPVTEEGRINVSLIGARPGGGETRSFVGSIDVLKGNGRDPVTVEWQSESPKVAICMATYNPPMELFYRQLQSIREQTHGNWICIVTDDSTDDYTRYVREAVAKDGRFIYHQNPKRLGFYLNFERAMQLVPTDAEFVVLADQDDYWYPDKIDTLLAAVDGKSLAYSDCHIVNEDGGMIHPSFWGGNRRNNFTDLPTLHIANTVTGAASLFRADLLDKILPLPQRVLDSYHDQWIALVARLTSGIAYVERPLYGYTQHGANVIGHNVNDAPGTLVYLREVYRYRKTAWLSFLNSMREGEKNFAWPVRNTVMARILLMRLDPEPEDRRVLQQFARYLTSLPMTARQRLAAAREKRCTFNLEGYMLHASWSVRLLSALARLRG